ncbi:helix-turn-helix transcriptional regulator [Paenibacillus soyae]|uniref:YafY family transcriptional regulator n=1 Tax=Paenibacillus soyae TaxID=2969249 RepID=A0A9X2MXC4_9BACL|nr:YafY family protein [Paenibacillus soyae]MCR2807571.1 YafY family transcriptional regulator [Paenibacillus soyae]
MKLDRLLAITMTLLNQPRVSAIDLAKRFEVSLRTIYRDMDAINQAGIPIVSFAGSDGGYEIMQGYRLEKQVLSMEDFSSICSALRGVRSATDQLEIDRLIERIGALMPEQNTARDQNIVDFDFKPAPNDKAHMGPLRQAIKDLQHVSFTYLDNKGAETERKLEPMGLFLKGYVWYVYGYCLTRLDIRVFRLSRIGELKVLPEHFARRDYTLQDVEKQFMNRTDFKRVQAVLLFQPEMKTRVRDEFGFDQVLVNADGTLSLITYFSSKERAIQKILSYGSMVKVLEPPDLIMNMQLQIQRMVELYRL